MSRKKERFLINDLFDKLKENRKDFYIEESVSLKYLFI
jgi:hypothetical protein